FHRGVAAGEAVLLDEELPDGLAFDPALVQREHALAQRLDERLLMRRALGSDWSAPVRATRTGPTSRSSSRVGGRRDSTRGPHPRDGVRNANAGVLLGRRPAKLP